jgi:hypothetical protein
MPDGLILPVPEEFERGAWLDPHLTNIALCEQLLD